MANTTPINECSIGADAEYTVKVATARGWSDFAIYPNGMLEGVNPDGQRDFVPDFAKMAKDAAFDMLAALKQIAQLEADRVGIWTWKDLACDAERIARAAIAKATGEAQ